MKDSDHRDSLDRLLAVARRLRRNEPFNSSTLGEEHGLSYKTIRRDLSLLRRHGWEIDWDARANTYTLRSAPPPRLF